MTLIDWFLSYWVDSVANVTEFGPPTPVEESKTRGFFFSLTRAGSQEWYIGVLFAITGSFCALVMIRGLYWSHYALETSKSLHNTVFQVRTTPIFRF